MTRSLCAEIDIRAELKSFGPSSWVQRNTRSRIFLFVADFLWRSMRVLSVGYHDPFPNTAALQSKPRQPYRTAKRTTKDKIYLILCPDSVKNWA